MVLYLGVWYWWHTIEKAIRAVQKGNADKEILLSTYCHWFGYHLSQKESVLRGGAGLQEVTVKLLASIVR